MNYRHAFHAGNPADVIKHAVLASVLLYLTKKDAPLRVIDTHAGGGLYDLQSDSALRTGEWVEGIGRLYGKSFSSRLEEFLAPYMSCVRHVNDDGQLRYYPGSPEIVRALTRPTDAIVLSEMHPQEAQTLAGRYVRDRRITVREGDGWLAPRALLPPPERRGLTLVDPPFEREGEFARLADALADGLKRFSTGVYCLWYPIKDGRAVGDFRSAVMALSPPKTLDISCIWRPLDGARLSGSGLIVVNAPYTLSATVQAVATEWLAAMAMPQARLAVTVMS